MCSRAWTPRQPSRSKVSSRRRVVTRGRDKLGTSPEPERLRTAAVAVSVGCVFAGNGHKLAERGGFEPPNREDPVNGFRDRRIQPLCHLSARRSQGRRAGVPAAPRASRRTPGGWWRRGWDSNPRGRLTPPTRFPVALLKPTRTPLRGASRRAVPESGRTVYDRARGGGTAVGLRGSCRISLCGPGAGCPWAPVAARR